MQPSVNVQIWGMKKGIEEKDILKKHPKLQTVPHTINKRVFKKCGLKVRK